MDDVEKRAKEIIDEDGDLTTGEEAQIQEFKQAVQDFLKKGSGLSEQRRQALLKHMTGWAPQFKDYTWKPGRLFSRDEDVTADRITLAPERPDQGAAVPG